MSFPTPTDLLFAAIDANNLPEIKAAITAGADLYSEAALGSHTPLEAALVSGKTAAAALLFSAGTPVRVTTRALYYAVGSGDLEILSQVLVAASPEDYAGLDGTLTPLMLAARFGRLDMCQLLIKHGVSPKTSVHGRRGLLDYALSEKDMRPSASILELVEFLLKSGAPVSSNSSPGPSPVLVRAINIGLLNQQFADESLGFELCKMLIDHGADVSFVDESGSLLHQVVRASSRESGVIIVEQKLIPFLIKSGADVNAKNNFGATPLLLASSAGRLSIAEQLLANGADITAVNNDGQTALHVANHAPMVRFLLAAGLSPAITDNSGITAEVYASRNDFESEIYAILRSARQLAELELSTTAGKANPPRSRV
jgi:ankyrin repeat protein